MRLRIIFMMDQLYKGTPLLGSMYMRLLVGQYSLVFQTEQFKLSINQSMFRCKFRAIICCQFLSHAYARKINLLTRRTTSESKKLRLGNVLIIIFVKEWQNLHCIYYRCSSFNTKMWTDKPRFTLCYCRGNILSSVRFRNCCPFGIMYCHSVRGV